jgi:hypothetical protein
MRKYFLIPLLCSTYVTMSLLTGSVLFNILKECSGIFDYITYGFISFIWIGLLLLGWILLINYINEDRNI